MDYSQILSTLYPEGSNGGQCGTFAHKLLEFPSIGNSLWSKIASVKKFGYTAAQLQGGYDAGDVIITRESLVFGHVAFVNNIIGDNLQLTESNYHLDQRVHHTRLLSKYSPLIIGCIRGKLLFAVPFKPSTQYPIQIPLTILLNNKDGGDNQEWLYQNWSSLLQHMANLQYWFYENSNKRIQLVIDYKIVNLTSWPTKFYGDNPRTEEIDEAWYNANVISQAPYAKIIVLNIQKKDWGGVVFDHPEQRELGYCYEYSLNNPDSRKLPIRVLTTIDQYDDYAPYYPGLGAFAKYMAHEISHGLYGICGGGNVVPGGDYTHNWFYGQVGYPVRPEGIFSNFDYNKLYDVINS